MDSLLMKPSAACRPHTAAAAAVLKQRFFSANKIASCTWRACSTARAGGAALARRQQAQAAAAQQPPQQPDQEDVEAEGGLLPEEDAEIPGTYRDAMSASTQLGKAVRGACEELDALGQLEQQTLEQAEQLLKSVGWKGSLFVGGQAGSTDPSGDEVDLQP